MTEYLCHSFDCFSREKMISMSIRSWFFYYLLVSFRSCQLRGFSKSKHFYLVFCISYCYSAMWSHTFISFGRDKDESSRVVGFISSMFKVIGLSWIWSNKKCSLKVYIQHSFSNPLRLHFDTIVLLVNMYLTMLAGLQVVLF